MSETGWFPRRTFGTGSEFTFQSPKSSTWTIRDKISQHNWQSEEPQPGEKLRRGEPGFGQSSAEATFHVQRESDGEIAFMRVHIQVPHLGTEYEDAEYRRLQARKSPPEEVQAVKDFHNEHVTWAPALLGLKEEVQGSDGYIPGGFVVFIVFEQVPGIRLADDQSAPHPGFPLHTFFQRFERAERDKIREKFDMAILEMTRIEWILDNPWADHLVWHSETSKL